MTKQWHLEGPLRGTSAPSLEDALRRINEGRTGPARVEDRPPVSTFPMTPAARAALVMAKGSGDRRPVRPAQLLLIAASSSPGAL